MQSIWPTLFLNSFTTRWVTSHILRSASLCSWFKETPQQLWPCLHNWAISVGHCYAQLSRPEQRGPGCDPGQMYRVWAQFQGRRHHTVNKQNKTICLFKGPVGILLPLWGSVALINFIFYKYIGETERGQWYW